MIFISTSDLMDNNWQFLAPVSSNPSVRWSTHSGMPKNTVERLIRKPALARYRAAYSAGRAARHATDAILVSHLPNMGAATNIARRRLCPDVPQIAFSFNFTDIPNGLRLRYLKSALKGIDEFVVFSRFERQLYADQLGIPIDHIRYLPWAMEPPKPGTENLAGPSPYFCSIGGEGRDYALLADVMRKLPTIRMVIVGRPQSVTGIDFPDNVTVFTNLPGPQTWRIAQDSLGMVIPLKTGETACGHITLVGAQQLGIPLAITQSRGVEDYVENGETACVVPANDPKELADAIRHLNEDRSAALGLAATAQRQSKRQNSLSTWLDYFEDIQSRFGN